MRLLECILPQKYHKKKLFVILTNQTSGIEFGSAIQGSLGPVSGAANGLRVTASDLSSRGVLRNKGERKS